MRRFSQLFVVLAILLSGTVLVPHAGFPSERFGWQLFAQVYKPFYYAHVTLSNNGLVALVDTASHTVVGTVNVGAAGCDFPWRATMSPNGAYVYVSCHNSGNVAVIETAGNTVVTTVGGIPSADGIAFTRDGAYALVGSRRSSQIAVVDTTSYSLMFFIPTPSNARSVATHPYLDIAYATSGDGTIQVIDTTTFNITTAIRVGCDPHDVAVSPDGQWVFAGSRQGDGLAVIDAGSNTLHTTVTGLGDLLAGLEVAPDGSAVYACGLGNGVHVIDGVTFNHIKTVVLVGNAAAAAVTCDGSELYVGNIRRRVPVIDTGTYSVTEQIAVPGSGARGIAICPQYVATGVVFLSPPAQTNQGGRGQVVAHEGRLINATGATDSFSLTLGSHAWDTALSTSSLGPIADSDSVTFTVGVTVPVDADWYSTDTVAITANSVANPTVYSDTATFTTQAYAPPVCSLSPDVLTSIQYVDQIVTRPLTISNGNGVTLTVNISEIDPTLALQALSPPNLAGKRILYDLGHGEPRSRAYSHLINDATSAGAVLTENWYSIDATVLEGYDVLWVNCCGHTGWYTDELDAVNDWLNQGGAVLVQGESSDATDGPASIFGIGYRSGDCNSGTTTNIADHLISEGVSAVDVEETCGWLAPSSGAQIVVFDREGQPHLVAQEHNAGKMVVVASEDFIDWHIDNDDNRLLANNILAWLARPVYSEVPWLSATPQAGTIPSDSSLPITLEFDTTALSLGDYRAILAIEHNDPSQSSPIEVPVTLAVESQIPPELFLPLILKKALYQQSD